MCGGCMKGCRDLTDNEYQSLMDYFTRENKLRSKALFAIQRWAGYRISEVLSLKVEDVFHVTGDSIEVVDRIHVDRKHMKGSRSPRRMPVHERLEEVLLEYIAELSAREGFTPGWHLFKSRKGENKPISYVQAWRILKKAYKALDIRENVATHSLRKTFAKSVYENTDRDIVATMEIMDHTSPQTTLAYLSVNQQKLEQAVLSQ